MPHRKITYSSAQGCDKRWSYAAALSHGATLARPGIVKASAGTKAGSTVLIETLKGEAVSIAELTVDSDALPEIDSGEIAIPKSVLMSPGTYPQTWSKSN